VKQFCLAIFFLLFCSFAWAQPILSVSATHTNSTCGNSNGQITAIASGVPPYQYSLDGTTFQPSGNFLNLKAATYTITAKDATGGTKTTSIVVGNVAGPGLTATSTPSFCNNNSGSITLTPSGGTPPFEYNLNLQSLQQDSVFSKMAIGPYEAGIKDKNGCMATANVLVALHDDLRVLGPDSLITCEGRKSTIHITSNAAAFYWEPVEGITDPLALSAEVTPVNDAVYTITSSLGICTTRGSVLVVVHKQPVVDAGVDQRIIIGSGLQLQPVVNDSSSFTFSWSPANNVSDIHTLRPFVKPMQSQTYKLTAVGKGNCTASDSVHITVFTPIDIPNAFSPNNDGIYDTWTIKTLEDLSNAMIQIFDRYGQLVHQSVGAKSWDGTFNGKVLPTATYYYVVDLRKPGFERLSGSVTLLR
jgi:gliding motility-associated-like protein